MSDEDLANVRWAIEVGIDFVGLSFVRAAEEVRELKRILRGGGSNAQVIAKIEKPEALERLEEIVDAADGIMVARGDLGVEINVAEVPMAQKRIVRACNERQKPVIIATQMLDSMQRSRWPTRAETTDVANAILDGADACMLSGETAIGDYPVHAVKMLMSIARSTEVAYRDRQLRPSPEKVIEGVHPITQAVVYGAGRIARQLNAQLMVVSSHTGATVLAASKRRGHVPIIGISDSQTTLRKLCLYWGVEPIAGAPASRVPDLLAFIDHWGHEVAKLHSGERVVVITGAGVSAVGHNLVVVHEIE